MCFNETKQENTMKRVSFTLVLVALLLSFGLANATFRVEMDTYVEGAAGCTAGEFINPGNDIDVRLYFTNDVMVLTGRCGRSNLPVDWKIAQRRRFQNITGSRRPIGRETGGAEKPVEGLSCERAEGLLLQGTG